MRLLTSCSVPWVSLNTTWCLTPRSRQYLKTHHTQLCALQWPHIPLAPHLAQAHNILEHLLSTPCWLLPCTVSPALPSATSRSLEGGIIQNPREHHTETPHTCLSV